MIIHTGPCHISIIVYLRFAFIFMKKMYWHFWVSSPAPRHGEAKWVCAFLQEQQIQTLETWSFWQSHRHGCGHVTSMRHNVNNSTKHYFPLLKSAVKMCTSTLAAATWIWGSADKHMLVSEAREASRRFSLNSDPAQTWDRERLRQRKTVQVQLNRWTCGHLTDRLGCRRVIRWCDPSQMNPSSLWAAVKPVMHHPAGPLATVSTGAVQIKYQKVGPMQKLKQYLNRISCPKAHEWTVYAWLPVKDAQSKMQAWPLWREISLNIMIDN